MKGRKESRLERVAFACADIVLFGAFATILLAGGARVEYSKLRSLISHAVKPRKKGTIRFKQGQYGRDRMTTIPFGSEFYLIRENVDEGKSSLLGSVVNSGKVYVSGYIPQGDPFPSPMRGRKVNYWDVRELK